MCWALVRGWHTAVHRNNNKKPSLNEKGGEGVPWVNKDILRIAKRTVVKIQKLHFPWKAVYNKIKNYFR